MEPVLSPGSSPAPEPRRRRRVAPAVLLAVAAAAIVAVVLIVRPFGGEARAPQEVNQFAERPQLASANSLLVAAAKQQRADGDSESAAVVEAVADVPTGLWLTPEAYPAESVAPYVASLLTQADSAYVPLLVIYGIPDRDCSGGFSAGGLTPETYLPWVREIAGAAAVDEHSVVVLEPDALAGSVECGDTESRIRLVHDAVDVLREAGVTTYVDAGHSDWVPVAMMARLLERVGVESVRGFTTNVANYQPEGAELDYARQLSARLGGAHFLIDTGRNGASTASGQPVTDWCNPDGQSLGRMPGYLDDDTPLDAVAWIKPPAESDGTCHGGPPAGEIWTTRLVNLAKSTGSSLAR